MGIKTVVLAIIFCILFFFVFFLGCNKRGISASEFGIHNVSKTPGVYDDDMGSAYINKKMYNSTKLVELTAMILRDRNSVSVVEVGAYVKITYTSTPKK